MEAVPSSARRERLSSLHPLWGIPALVRYLRRSRPQAVLVHRLRLLRPLQRACVVAAHRCRIVAVIHSDFVGQADLDEDTLRRRLRHLQRLKECDALIAVSASTARNVARYLGVPLESLRIAYPPVSRAALRRSAEAVTAQRRPRRYLIAVGRLEAQKDFGVLLRAFARLTAAHPELELVIIGEGRERQALTALADQLGIVDRVQMPGFQPNPYPWIAHAELLVLSSRWEGFGMVLAEALALAVPVVAADCPSGPREILCDGRYGRLVPPGDPDALADAILAALSEPTDAERLHDAVERFQPAASTTVYLEAMGLTAAVGVAR